MIPRHTIKCGMVAGARVSRGTSGEHTFHINFGVATRGKHNDGILK
jgi:hypothetical protein